jgi:hypothetical protein
MHILNLAFHTHEQSPAIFFMKAPNNELSAFMMRIIDNRFAHHEYT